MLHSQERSKHFRRRTEYWDAQNNVLVPFWDEALQHSFQELFPIEEDPCVRLTRQHQPSIPPLTVGKVTTRHPRTTVDGKLPRNTFFRRSDGKLVLESKIGNIDRVVTCNRPDCFHRQKSEEDIYNSKANMKTSSANVRARAEQIVRSKSSEDIAKRKTQKSSKKKKARCHEEKTSSPFDDEFMVKMLKADTLLVYEKKPDSFLSQCKNSPKITVDGGRPAIESIDIQAEQYAYDFNKKAYKFREEENLPSAVIATTAHTLGSETGWSYLWTGTKECCRLAFLGAQFQCQCVVERVVQMKKLLKKNVMLKDRNAILDSDGSEMSWMNL